MTDRQDKPTSAPEHANAGLSQARSGDFAEALVSFDKALQLFGEVGDRLSEALLWGNIGSVHRDSDDWTQALAAYGKSLELMQSLTCQRGIADQCTNIAYIKARQGELQASLHWYRQALPLYRETQMHDQFTQTEENIRRLRELLGSGAP